MATFKYVWVSLALVGILVLLEKGILEEQPSGLDVQESHENLWLSHTRQKRNDQPFHTYEVEVELNLTDIRTLDQIRILLSSLNVTGSDVTVTDLKITTVCSPNGSHFLCRCEDPFVWSAEKCVTYGACSQVVGDSCTCISSVPADGQYCQPADAPPAAAYEYQIWVEVNTTQLSALRDAVNSISPLQIDSRVNISDAVITTVCSPSSDGFQCRCEDEHRWSCDQCETHQPCDNVTDGACGCISRLPDGGPYCLAVDQHNFTECGTSTTTIATSTAGTTNSTPVATTNTSTTATTVSTTDMNTTATPTTNPPDLQEYLVSLELNVTDGRLLEQVRNVLTGRLPFVTHGFQISAVNISTVCVPSGGTFQCTCEDGYRWSCDQCQRYESCDGVANDTCGCVSGIPPDGDFCRSVDEHNVTECNTTRTTAAPPTDTTTTSTSAVTNETTITTTTSFTFPTNSTPVATTNTSTTATTVSTTDMNTTATPTTNPPDLQEYLVSLELNVTDGRLLEQVRNVLTGRLPFVTHGFQISAVNISTVCVPSGGTFQCTCEDGYRWSCDQCQRYESCDGVANDTCGCVSGIPPDGDFCRSVDEHNVTECNTTRTTAAPPTDTTSMTTTSTSAVTNATTVSTTGVNTTVTASPTTNSTTGVTTHMSTTTTTTTTVSTTGVKTTTVPTTNSTPVVTTRMPTTTTTVSTTGVKTTTAPTPSPSTEAPTPPTTPTTEPTVRTVSMSVTLDLTYTEELADSGSERYIDLESRLNEVFTVQYQAINGFREVSVTRFRPGSVIVDFSISTTAFSANEITNLNENLPSALSGIAPVIGRVVAQINGETPIEQPETTFTTRDMMLTCGPPEVNVGDITASEWKFNGSEIMGERREIALSGDTSTLTVRNVIQSDNGDYECTLKANGSLNYVQRGVVQADVIIAAPVVRLQNRINTQCEVGRTQPLECCVQAPFEVTWVNEGQELEPTPSPEAGCITSDYTIESCNQAETTETFTCQVNGREEFSKVTRLTIFNSDVVCNDNVYGRGRAGDESSARCGPGQQGTRTAVCEERTWKLRVDTCILTPINDFLIRSEDLSEELVPEFTKQFNEAVQDATEDISQSPATIDAVVQILNSIANATAVVSENVTQNVLEVLDVIIGDNSRESWIFLNSNETRNTSSGLLGSMETLADRVEGIFTVETPRILFSRTAFNDSFMADLNSSVFINIPQSDVSNVNITTITFPTLDNVMPTRNSTSELDSFTGNNTNQTATVINAAVVLIRISNSVPNVTLTYQKLNQSLEQDVQCVFWNFQLFDSLGAWDNQGCRLETQGDDNVTCFCDHLTSFSILMSTNIPEDIILLLDIITYIGVGISMASLVICLIIEGYVWKDVTRNSTAYIRHVSIINTALSLLIANICFIIGAAIAKNESENPNEDHRVPVGPCTTATFFMHFFYLAVFFWMLVSGLLLLYRTVMVFSQMSKSTMLAIGFTLGYVCPLLIAVVTVAATAGQGGYIREDLACWLNWTQTHALLAMVIPALIIVSINFVIVIIVLFKMLRRGVGSTSQPDEKNSVLVIIRCVAILTPLFGLTWGLGVGTMISPDNRGIHIAFAFFNSFQGFFILVFGTLLDSKIRALLSRRIPALTSGSHPTQSTSGGFSSLSGKNLFNRFRRNRNVYHVSDAANSNANSNSASETFINT